MLQCTVAQARSRIMPVNSTLEMWTLFDKLPVLYTNLLSVADAPSYVKGYTVHIVYISFALLVSATIAIWNLVVGQQLRGALLGLPTSLPYVKFVKSFATWQHQFDVDSNFLSYLLPCPWYNFVQNVISSSVGGSDYLPQISSKSVQYSSEAKKCRCVAGHLIGRVSFTFFLWHSRRFYASNS